MAKFEYAIGTVLKHEGGFVNNPRDPGGATNYGISLKYLRAQNLINGDFNHDGNIDINDIKSMKTPDAIEIYHRLWNIYGYSRINDDTVATKIFDSSINMGQRQATILAQETCDILSDPDTKIAIDGIMGVYTVEAINIVKPEIFLREYRNQCQIFYNMLIHKNPSLDEFREGWMRRAQS